MYYLRLSLILLALFLLPKQSAWCTAPQNAGEWHVLLLGATEDRSLNKVNNRQIVVKLMKHAEQHFQEYARAMNLKLHIHRVTGMDFIKSKIEAKFEKLMKLPHPGKGKFLFTVFSSSHGGNFAQSNTSFPYMLCNPVDKSCTGPDMLLGVEEMYDLFLKQSRFDHVHFWMELCNEVDNTTVPKSTVSLATLVGANLEQLLYGVKGSLLVSSKRGQLSWSHPKTLGLFSSTLFECLDGVGAGSLQPNIEHQFWQQLRGNTMDKADRVGLQQEPLARIDKFAAQARRGGTSGTGRSIIKVILDEYDASPIQRAPSTRSHQPAVYDASIDVGF